MKACAVVSMQTLTLFVETGVDLCSINGITKMSFLPFMQITCSHISSYRNSYDFSVIKTVLP